MPPKPVVEILNATFCAARSITAIVLFALFVTIARFRKLSTATPVGAAEPLGHGGATLVPTVQIVATTVGDDRVKSISVTLSEPRFATTAMPVAVLTATAEGDVPTARGEPASCVTAEGP